MLTRPLGSSGLQVSVVGIGTAQLRCVPAQQALETLCCAFNLGVTLVHTAPDYEGADDLVAEALAASGREVIVASQGYGSREHFEHLFENTCRKFGKKRLELFGIACIDDREACGEDVWGPNGIVQFLATKKQEGRLLASFCTTHGSPKYVHELIDSGSFDAIMMAYNPLGFHLLSHRANDESMAECVPENVKLFAHAARRGVGIILMKPLAGGLLCQPGAFEPFERSIASSPLRAGAVLRYLLANHPEISAVVPGTASPDEARENATAGHGPIAVNDQERLAIEGNIPKLQATICSRCGVCDDLCSRKLPVSWLFRAAFIDNSRCMPFETPNQHRYFDLHPQQPDALCVTCDDITCRCPYEIDIPQALTRTHKVVHGLLQRGVSRTSLPLPDTREAYHATLVAWDLDQSCRPGHSPWCRLSVLNSGTNGWHPADPHPEVSLEVFRGDIRLCNLRVSYDVGPGHECQLTFALLGKRKNGALGMAWRRIKRTDTTRLKVAFLRCEMVFRNRNSATPRRIVLGTVPLPDS